MRICLVYDCLFPYTVGGAERWYRALAERLAADGNDVTYLTLRQWDRGSQGEIPGVRVVSVGPRMGLYTASGRRRIAPTLVFGAGVFWHLLRRGRRYDAVHTASFPYFSVLAAAAARPLHRFALVVDWLEVWSRAYWHEYLGPVGGRVASAVQALCMRVPQRAFSFSRLHAQRLRDGGFRGRVTVLEGAYSGDLSPAPPNGSVSSSMVLFAGRLIPEKQAAALVPAIALARERLPSLTGTIIGDGPEQAAVVEAVRAHDLEDVVALPGFVAHEALDSAMAEALCLVLPSRREGYGLVVIEAAAKGTPSIVVAAPDNAAVELIEDGVNGTVAASAAPADLSAAIERVSAAGAGMRESTRRWFERNAGRLSLESSLDAVLESYRRGGAQDSG